RRDPLGDAEDRGDSRCRGLQDRVRCAAGRDEDAGGVRAGLANAVGDGVEDRHSVVQRLLAALARGHAGDDVRAVGLHRAGVELALAAGDALDQEARVAPDEDAHPAGPAAPARATPAAPARAAFADATAFAAASSSDAAVAKCASSSRRAASSAFVPTMRTTIGTSRDWRLRASMRPWATSSPRVMPPKMLTRIASTFGSARIRRIAAATLSALAPP